MKYVYLSCRLTILFLILLLLQLRNMFDDNEIPQVHISSEDVKHLSKNDVVSLELLKRGNRLMKSLKKVRLY